MREGAVEFIGPEGDVDQSGPPLRLLFVSLTGCPPCDVVKEAMREVAPRVRDQIEIETLVLDTDEFAELCARGKLPVRGVPALILYQGDRVVARVVGLTGKHGKLDAPFIGRWLGRHGIRLPDPDALQWDSAPTEQPRA
jgi:thiol-disulfide isomerase/thioredoxin